MNRPAAPVRPMRADDLPRVLAIAAALQHAPHWPESVYRAAIASSATAEPLRRIALVIEDPMTAQVAGFAVASLLPPQCELESIAVALESQRRGLARQLLIALASQLRSAGVTELLLEVRASNAPALSLYRRLGFTETGRRPGYYADPVEDAVLMTLQLSGFSLSAPM